MFRKRLPVFLTLAFILLASFSTAFAAEKPVVKILATGGTIAGSASTSTQMTGYTAGAIGIQTLIDAVPQMKEYADVSGEQIVKISSNNMTNDVWLKIAKRCNELLADPNVNGIVITHGTDTMEETAYFLNLVVKSDKPVILVGAMRPATAISADGPVNLLNAVRLAASPEAIGKGVLVVMNDQISGARDVTKTNTSNVATFKAPELGYMGYFTGGKPYFYHVSTRKHTFLSEFDVTNLTELPRVDIVYAHANDDRVLVDAAIAAGAKGIISAGSGMGSIQETTEKGLVDAQKQGVVIVRSSRVGNGLVVKGIQRYTDQKFLNGDNLNPQKARILLQLALTKTTDLEEIQRIFDEY